MKLSERMRTKQKSYVYVAGETLNAWADEVAALEAKLEAVEQALKLADKRILGAQFGVRMALMAAQDNDLSELPTQQKLTEEDMERN